MKKIGIAILTFIVLFTAISGMALAGSAPSARSYFTSAAYNKTFEDDQGISHTVMAAKVSEVWNKAGSVLHIIETKETYTDADGNDHVIVRDDSKIYGDACPKYPDNPHQTVYRVEWYPDGHSQVVYDYRPAATPTPAPATSEPTATQSPMVRPMVKPTPKPTVKPTAKPTAKPTLEPAASPTATPTATSADTVAVSTAPPSLSPSASPIPMPSASPSPRTASAASSILGATDAMLPATAMPAQSGGYAPTADSMWWGVAVFVLLAIFLLYLMLQRRRKEKRKNEVDKA